MSKTGIDNILAYDKYTDSKSVYIIDSISSAFAVAVIAAGKKVSCIYECKNINWRKTDYVKLFDIILSNVNIVDKKIYNVPHPYFINSKNVFKVIFDQICFILKVRSIVKLDR